MNYADEIFIRADIQQIREFLLHGANEKTTVNGLERSFLMVYSVYICFPVSLSVNTAS